MYFHSTSLLNNIVISRLEPAIGVVGVRVDGEQLSLRSHQSFGHISAIVWIYQQNKKQ